MLTETKFISVTYKICSCAASFEETTTVAFPNQHPLYEFQNKILFPKRQNASGVIPLQLTIHPFFLTAFHKEREREKKR